MKVFIYPWKIYFNKNISYLSTEEQNQRLCSYKIQRHLLNIPERLMIFMKI